MKMDYQDRIDDYLFNRMPETERERFESDADYNEELREQLSFTQSVKRTVECRGERLEKMKIWQDDYVWKNEADFEYRAAANGYDCFSSSSFESHKPLFRFPFRRIVYWASGIAAAAGAGLFLFMSSYSGDRRGVGNVSDRMAEMSVRAGSDNSDIESLLVDEQYENAAALIEERILRLRTDSLTLVRDAAMNEDQRKYDLQVLEDKQDELIWLKIQALLGQDRQKSAIELLNVLRNKEGLYRFSADSLYNTVK